MAIDGGLELLGGFLSARDLKRSVLTRTGPPAHMTEARAKVERAKFFTRTTLQAAAVAFKERMIRERLSAVANYRVRLPLDAGLRRKRGKLIRSLRTTVTGGGAQGDRQKLSAKIGGGQALYAIIHERKGRLQFQRVFEEERARALGLIQRGVQRILGTPGTSYVAGGA